MLLLVFLKCIRPKTLFGWVIVILLEFFNFMRSAWLFVWQMNALTWHLWQQYHGPLLNIVLLWNLQQIYECIRFVYITLLKTRHYLTNDDKVTTSMSANTLIGPNLPLKVNALKKWVWLLGWCNKLWFDTITQSF
jgi:hypothetical protein